MKVLALLLIIFYCFSAMAGNCKIDTYEKKIISTQYHDLKVNEYIILGEKLKLSSILILSDQIVITTENGHFYVINKNLSDCNTNFLPNVNLKNENILSSKRITYKELDPRVIDLLNYRDDFYITYTKYDPNKDGVRFHLAKLNKNSKQWEDLYKTIPLDTHYFSLGDGGVMAARENKIYFSIGDFSLDRINNLESDVAPQNNQQPFGKIHYYDLNKKKTRIYSIGHRNIKGLTFTSNGELISTEMGPKGGDEINRIKKNGNYGWPYKSFGLKYGTFKKYSEELNSEELKKIYFQKKFIQPIYAFIPSISPTSVLEIRNFSKEWNGNLLIGSLTEKSIFSLKKAKDKIIYSEKIFVNRRIRNIKQKENMIAAVTDSGTIILIEKQ